LLIARVLPERRTTTEEDAPRAAGRWY
jgi:hypothetical protein